MNLHHIIWISILALTPAAVRGEDFMDRLGDKLTVSGFDDQVRFRLSGLLDIEYYDFSGDAPGLIFTDDGQLWNSRLTLFLDGQLGPHFYLFAQARVDRGFDPSDESLGVRLDEYALRWTPWDDGRLNIQAGQFGTVVGNASKRHHSWENPFINAPLIYENMTRIYDSAPPRYPGDKYYYNPVIWGPSYATGLSVSGRLGKFDYAAEIKNAGLSSRPESWDVTERGFDDPTFSARAGYRPDMAWDLGFSASAGPYYTDEAEDRLPPGSGPGDYLQIVLGQDLSYAWEHWQLWIEVYEARFEVPNLGDADTLGYYVEAKYKFTPNLFGALRWNQQFFGDVSYGNGTKQPWGNDISRLDAAMTYRFTPSSQMKLQYGIQHEDRADDDVSHLVAAQFTVRF
jgi:hypothetical protein